MKLVNSEFQLFGDPLYDQRDVSTAVLPFFEVLGLSQTNLFYSYVLLYYDTLRYDYDITTDYAIKTLQHEINHFRGVIYCEVSIFYSSSLLETMGILQSSTEVSLWLILKSLNSFILMNKIYFEFQISTKL